MSRWRWRNPARVISRDWYYSVAYKHPRRSALRWVDTFVKDVVEASKVAARFAPSPPSATCGTLRSDDHEATGDHDVVHGSTMEKLFTQVINSQ